VADVKGRARIEGVAASIHESYMDAHGNKVAEDAVFKSPCVVIIFDRAPRYREVQLKNLLLRKSILTLAGYKWRVAAAGLKPLRLPRAWPGRGLSDRSTCSNMNFISFEEVCCFVLLTRE